MLIRRPLEKSRLFKQIAATTEQRRTFVFDFSKHWDDHGPHVHLLDEKPSQTVELAKENGIQLYKDMHLIRRSEKACAGLYRKKLIRGFCHLYIGQEAIAVGINSVLNPKDTVVTSYRCHAWVILRTRNLIALFGELLGTSVGFCRGKGGSMHMFNQPFYGGHGIVGAHVPLGTGIGLRHQYSNSGNISVTALGDGAFNQGQVSEAFNFSKLHNLPVLYVVENNHYAMGTSSNRGSAFPQYYKWSASIPGIRANGMEVLSTIQAAQFAVEHIRNGKGPIILELMTYRYPGHSMSDPGTSYRDRDEVQQVRAHRDCLKHLEKLLTESNLATTKELFSIREENKKIINAAVTEAQEAKFPPLEELAADCYTDYSGKIRLPKLLTEVAYKRVAQYKKTKH